MLKRSKKFRKKKRRGLLTGSIAILLIVSGILLLGSNSFKLLKGYVLFKTSQVAESEESRHETRNTELKIKTAKFEKDAEPLLNDTKNYNKSPAIGDEMGQLYIPKLDATLPIFHGTNEDELEKGVGHFAGSVLPGEKDNSVLSGHRDTVFRKLGEVGKEDLLVVTTGTGTFTYKVRKVRIVDEDDRTVIVPTPKATLTVTTCYPFDFIGSAPERYVLVADLIKKS
ncbi:class D sortase [Metabacillus arenae]|uniref:Class D sortase n=1 Tax=Metabacillus arenae TaxID=2771434 RepID=A0A926RVI0_9BACI|nr:class D sortase [Metabacillus arenae]MBD1379713.1 class D sortase [Metabacillus arenae]